MGSEETDLYGLGSADSGQRARGPTGNGAGGAKGGRASNMIKETQPSVGEVHPAYGVRMKKNLKGTDRKYQRRP